MKDIICKQKNMSGASKDSIIEQWKNKIMKPDKMWPWMPKMIRKR